MAKYVTVTYDGEESTMNVNKLTFAEARAIEKVTGQRFAQMKSDAELFATADMLQAVVWVTIKRTRPGFRFSDLDDVPMQEIQVEVNDDESDEPEDDDPKADSAEPPAAG